MNKWITYVIEKNSSSSNESSRSFSIWHVVPILEVYWLLVGSGWVLGANFLKYNNGAQGGPAC